MIGSSSSNRNGGLDDQNDKVDRLTEGSLISNIRIEQHRSLTDVTQNNGRFSSFQVPGRSYRQPEIKIMKDFLTKNRDLSNPMLKCLEIESKIFKNRNRLGFM